MHTGEAPFVSLAALLQTRALSVGGQPVEPRRSPDPRPKQPLRAHSDHEPHSAREQSQPERSAREGSPPERSAREGSPPERSAREHSQPERSAREQSQPERSAREESQPEGSAREQSQPERSAGEQSQPDQCANELSLAGRSLWDPSHPERSAHAHSQPEHLTESAHLVPGVSGSDPADRVVREARFFQAALADAFDVRLGELMRGLAVEVLGRELRLAAVDIEALARGLIAERAADGPLRLRVALADSDLVCELPVLPDPTLGRGDAVLECRSGDIDARLQVRLAGVLAAVQP